MGGLVWLASFPKSGNTWTRNFLHALIHRSQETPDINAMRLLTSGDGAAAWYQDLLAKPLAECTKEEIAAVRPQAQKRIAASAKGLVFVKTHNALILSHGTPMIEGSVTAGAIYIVRNPLDVAISYASHLGSDIDTAIRSMNQSGYTIPTHEKNVYQVYGSWVENVESWTRKPKPQIFVMRYEDMLEKPFETFGALAQFLRIQPTRVELEKAIEVSSFENLKAQEDERGFVEKPKSAKTFFRSGKSGEWQAVLTKAQIDELMRGNRPQMERFGYLSKRL